ncbi:MAG: hypothetical protein AVDCRST_MAG68-4159, partial [uncultured Gemmatimonadetes bacterium]
GGQDLGGCAGPRRRDHGRDRGLRAVGRGPRQQAPHGGGRGRGLRGHPGALVRQRGRGAQGRAHPHLCLRRPRQPGVLAQDRGGGVVRLREALQGLLRPAGWERRQAVPGGPPLRAM